MPANSLQRWKKQSLLPQFSDNFLSNPSNILGKAAGCCAIDIHAGDLRRVNFEVTPLKPFPHLALPHFATSENSSKQLGFDGELMASSRCSKLHRVDTNSERPMAECR
jgi:hypothetical protein